MSQVGISRPGTQQSMLGRPNLPEIQHPLSRLGNPEMLDVRGSRGGDGISRSLDSGLGASGRPLAAENQYVTRRTHTSSGRNSRLTARLNMSAGGAPVRIEAIPEGVEVIGGDPSKTKLPVFGNRVDTAMGDRGDLMSRQQSRAASRVASRLSTATSQARLEIDELEALLKEKVTTNYHEVKKRFRDNDPEGKGNVSRDGLFRILVTVLNRPINTSQYGRLMERLGYKERNVINFTEFFSLFRETVSSNYPKWMDPIQRQVQERVTMGAAQVHAHLKEKAKKRVLDVVELVPQINPDGAGHLLKPEFRSALNKMGFFMDDHEFEKLWAKYDTDGCGTINGEVMMKKLGISISGGGDYSAPMFGAQPNHDEYQKEVAEIMSASRPIKKKEADRKRSLDIEKWLKKKFREGFAEMKSKFEALDPEQSGMVTHKNFLDILSQYGLPLQKAHLGEFLARCSVNPTNTRVPYREFLHRFQDRSEAGMAHKILTDSKHRYNQAASPDGVKSTFSSLETQLMNMFQKDFLALLGTFHKIDKLGTDTISQEEFRAAIESRFDLEMNDQQFTRLIDQVPLDDEGAVKYAEFMAQFDTRGKQPSLFDGEVSRPKYRAVGVLPQDPLPTPPSPPPSLPRDGDMKEDMGEADRLVVDAEKDAMVLADPPAQRSAHDLYKIIKNLLSNHYTRVEETFHELDEQNTRRLSQERMYQLLNQFDIQPAITRGEIRSLWKTFIVNTDKTLDFLQFTRHFGYSLRSAVFPNAKVNPPKRGDNDFMVRSRKLNCAADMLQDNLRAKIDYMWEELRKEFVAMDPYNTGCVTCEEFKDVLQELCVHLSEYELNMLTHKFSTMGDGRVSYIEFLKPFAMRRQVWRHGNNMLSLLQHPNAELPLAEIVESPTKGLPGLTTKLRQKVGNDWKNLRRSFKKIDQSNTGLIGLPEFRSALKLANIVLNEEEVYQLMSKFDDDMTGKIPYNKFIEETFRPSTRNTPLRKSANI